MKPMNAIDDFLMAMGSGLYQSSKAGLTGLANLPGGIDNAVKSMEESYDGYQPQTIEGAGAIHALGKVGEVVDKPFKWLGDKTLDITGSPAAATAAYTIPQFLALQGLAGKATAPIGPSVKTTGLHKKQGGMYMGPNAKSRKGGDSALDEKVRALSMGGALRDEVWWKTGETNEKGQLGYPAMIDQNGIIVHEISDAYTDLHLPKGGKDKQSTTLKDILFHPELYSEYPEVGNIRIDMRKSKLPGKHAGVSGTADLRDMDNPVLGINALDFRPEKKVKGSLLHEVQHYIQRKEGMPGGGSSAYWPNLDFIEAMQKYFAIQGERQARDTGDNADWFQERRIMTPTWYRDDRNNVQYDATQPVPLKIMY